jgi:HEPN domain-containing protein
MNLLDTAEFERWLAAAEDATRAAQVQADADGHNWACFLAEQAAQLAVKALLHGVGVGAWGHDLVVLGGGVAKQLQTALPAEVDAALRRLSRHYIPARYPDAHPSGPPALYYGAGDAEQALADSRTVRDFVDSVWAQLTSATPGGSDEPTGSA